MKKEETLYEKQEREIKKMIKRQISELKIVEEKQISNLKRQHLSSGLPLHN